MASPIVPAPMGSISPAAAQPLPSIENPSSSAVRQRTFSEPAGETTLFYQVLDLGRQYYVWISAGGAELSSLHFAIKSPRDPMPAVTAIIGDTAAGEGRSLAARLALKVRKPILCSCNLPGSEPMLQAIAEQRLLQELLSMEASKVDSSSTVAAAAL